MTNLQKFASQADTELLAAMRSLAKQEGKQFQALLDEAMRDFLEKKTGNKPRAQVMQALAESVADFDALYKELAK